MTSHSPFKQKPKKQRAEADANRVTPIQHQTSVAFVVCRSHPLRSLQHWMPGQGIPESFRQGVRHKEDAGAHPKSDDAERINGYPKRKGQGNDSVQETEAKAKKKSSSERIGGLDNIGGHHVDSGEPADDNESDSHATARQRFKQRTRQKNVKDFNFRKRQ